MKHELTKKILEYFAKTVHDEFSPAEVCRIVQTDLMEHIELTPVTAPFVLFALEDIVKALRCALDGKERETYDALRKVVSLEAYAVRFAAPFDPGEESSGEKK